MTMNDFEAAVRAVLNKYATFDGRASRSEFWYWVLFVVLVSVAINIAATIVSAIAMLGWLFSLAVLVPGIAVGVRRMHDVGKPGLIVLLGLIPIVGLYLIYLAVQPSQPGANAYGPAPAGAATPA